MTRRHVSLAAVSGVCFFGASWASELVVQANGLTVLWTANAVLLGLMLTCARDRAEAIACCAGAFLFSVIAAFGRGQPPLLGLSFAVANMVEAGLAARILHAFGGRTGLFARVQDVIALMVAAVLAPVPSATIGAAALSMTAGIPYSTAWVGWYASAVLSLALITPAVVTVIDLAELARRRPLCGRQVGEVILILAMVAGATIGVFYVSPLPALFALLPFVLLATFRLRQFGAVASVALVAILSAHATSDGVGPIAAAGAEIGLAGQLLYLQIFLAVTFLAALPVAAALAERDARAEEAHLLADHFKAVVDNVSEVIFRTDRAGRWTYLNPAWESLSGYDVDVSIGRSWDDCIDPAEHREVAIWAAPVFAGEVLATRRMLRIHTAAGLVRWMELSIQALADKDGDIIGTTGTLRDVHDRKRLEDQVMGAKRLAEERERAATLLATTDELTGLPNRRAFLANLDRQIAAERESGLPFAIAIFDVDHFKLVNDGHGHAIGDKVLQRVAARAASVVRADDVVGRLGGEEFGILMPGAALDDASAIAERLCQAIRCDAEEAEQLPGVTVSVGIATHASRQSAASLLREADRALYAAKGAGRDMVRIAA